MIVAIRRRMLGLRFCSEFTAFNNQLLDKPVTDRSTTEDESFDYIELNFRARYLQLLP